jgi:hypothetical protein
MGPSESHEKKVSRKNPNMGLQAILNQLPEEIYEDQTLSVLPE